MPLGKPLAHHETQLLSSIVLEFLQHKSFGFVLQAFMYSVGSLCHNYVTFVGSVVEWLKHRTDDQHGLGSKPTYAILLCPWKDTLRHFPLLGGLDKQY